MKWSNDVENIGHKFYALIIIILIMTSYSTVRESTLYKMKIQKQRIMYGTRR
jgi:hypothetical protein